MNSFEKPKSLKETSSGEIVEHAENVINDISKERERIIDLIKAFAEQEGIQYEDALEFALEPDKEKAKILLDALKRKNERN